SEVLRNFHAWVLCGFGALHPSAIALSIGVASRSTLGRFCRSTAATTIVRLACALPQRAKRGPKFGREQVGFFPRWEVAPLVHLVEVDGVGVRPLDPATRRPPDLPGERREADRNRDRRGRLAGCTSVFLSFLPVRTRRRGPGSGQPIQRDVVDDVFLG